MRQLVGKVRQLVGSLRKLLINVIKAPGSKWESFLHLDTTNPELVNRIYHYDDYSRFIPESFILKNLEILFNFQIEPITGLNMQLYILSLLLVLYDDFFKK